MQLCFESSCCPNNLTPVEEKARDEMVNLFNPVLKSLLCMSNTQEWVRYGFNSCRQTAIFGAIYLQKLLPDYTIVPYEGIFFEFNQGKPSETYEHCFIVASNGNRNILIDLSRTSERLLFYEMKAFSYPTTDEYSNTLLLSKQIIDLQIAYHNNDIAEYFTHLRPKDVMKCIEQSIENLKNQPVNMQKVFCYDIYKAFTKLLN